MSLQTPIQPGDNYREIHAKNPARFSLRRRIVGVRAMARELRYLTRIDVLSLAEYLMTEVFNDRSEYDAVEATSRTETIAYVERQLADLDEQPDDRLVFSSRLLPDPNSYTRTRVGWYIGDPHDEIVQAHNLSGLVLAA